MKLIEGGKEQRLLKARALLYQFGITGDESYLEQVKDMALQDARRAKLTVIKPSDHGAQADQQPRSEPSSLRQ